MTELPWPAVTAATGGWLLAFLVIWRVMSMVTKGDLLTRREADGKDAENVRLREDKDYLQEKLGTALSALQAQNDMASAIRNAAEERRA